jgi:Flp pilus assembly pilin Flp
MMNRLIKYDTDSGQTMAEYALVLSVISVVIVATISLISDGIAAAFLRTFNVLTSIV